MCGILGVVATSPVNQLLYDGLLVLQHRGQDAAGIATAGSWARPPRRAGCGTPAEIADTMPPHMPAQCTPPSKPTTKTAANPRFIEGPVENGSRSVGPPAHTTLE